MGSKSFVMNRQAPPRLSGVSVAKTQRTTKKEVPVFKKYTFLFLASWRLGGEILFFSLPLVILLMAGCGGREMVKTGGNPPVVAATPAPSGPKAPSLVDLRTPVTDADYQQAMAAVGSSEVDRHNADQFLTIAQYQYNHGNLTDALKTYQRTLLATNASTQGDKAQYMVGQIYYEKQDFLPALASFQNVLAKYPQSPYATQGRQMMDFMLSFSLNLDDLKSYVNNYPDSPLQCSALFQLGSHEAQAGIQNDAIGHLNQFVQQCPQHPSVSAAQLLLQSLQSQSQGKTWKIGVMIPRTGRFQVFGDSVLNGISLAVEQANQSGGSKKHMDVVVEDTGSEGIKAVTEFQDMVKDDSLDAIIGPVAPADIQAVAALANERHISMICPAASREGLSTLGPYLFSNSMTNEMQGKAIAKYAVEHLGFKRFAILSPDDLYGQTLSESFQKTVQSMGASVVASDTYVPGSTDFKAPLVDLGGQDPESSKENDRENARRLEELKYAISKEIGKIFLKVKDLSTASGVAPTTTPVAAFAPMVESLSNTVCPSIVKDIDEAVKDSVVTQTGFTFRTDDIIKQSLQRLPIELQGTTMTATADQWGEVAQDMQASLIITGHILEPAPENDWSTHPAWDYNVHFEAFFEDPKSNAMVKIYQSKLPYSVFKPSSMIRGNNSYQALYLPAHAVEVPLLVSQIHFYDLSPVFLGGHLWDNDTILQEAAKDMEGSFFVTGFYVDSQQGPVKKFVDDYVSKFAKRPDLLAAQAYDATRLLLQAADISVTRDDIHNNLLQIKDFDGVSGKTTFGGFGEADKLVPILQIKDGKYQQVQ